MVPSEISTELSNMSSGTVLMLLVNLRLCNTQKSLSITTNSDEISNECFTKNDVNKSIRVFNGCTLSSSKSNNLSLKYILNKITEWIIVSGVTSQKLRMNLYASFLNFLHLIEDNIRNLEHKEITDEL